LNRNISALAVISVPSLTMTGPPGIRDMSLRDEVELLLPNWESWYPSLFDAALDLGLIRARACSPASLLLSSRHSGIHSDALKAFREKWGDSGGDG